LKRKLKRLLREYVSEKTAIEILGIEPGMISDEYRKLGKEIGGFTLYPLGVVAQKVIDDLDDKAKQEDPKKSLRALAAAVAERFPADEKEPTNR
jgi:hypothetical protein